MHFSAIGKLCCQCILLSELLYVKNILIANLLIKSMTLDPSLKAVNALVTIFFSTIGLVKQIFLLRKIAIFFFFSISLNMCFGCSKGPSHPGSSFEYPQHMFWLRNNKNNFQLHTLIWGPEHNVGIKLVNSFRNGHLPQSKPVYDGHSFNVRKGK